MIELNEQQIIDHMTARLSEKYPRVPTETVSRLIQEEYPRFDDRPLREYLPLFVERNAEAELAKLAGVLLSPRKTRIQRIEHATN